MADANIAAALSMMHSMMEKTLAANERIADINQRMTAGIGDTIKSLLSARADTAPAAAPADALTAAPAPTVVLPTPTEIVAQPATDDPAVLPPTPPPAAAADVPTPPQAADDVPDTPLLTLSAVPTSPPAATDVPQLSLAVAADADDDVPVASKRPRVAFEDVSMALKRGFWIDTQAELANRVFDLQSATKHTFMRVTDKNGLTFQCCNKGCMVAVRARLQWNNALKITHSTIIAEECPSDTQKIWNLQEVMSVLRHDPCDITKSATALYGPFVEKYGACVPGISTFSRAVFAVRAENKKQ